MANTTITPGVTSLRLTTSTVIGPIVQALLLLGTVPLLSQSVTIPPATVTLVTANPVLNNGTTVPVISLPVSGTSPVLSFGSAPSPAAGTVALSASAPGLSINTTTPVTGTIAATGNSPSIIVPNQTLVPVCPLLSLTGHTPGVVTNIPAVSSGSISFLGVAPLLGLNILLSPVGTGSLVLTTYSVTIDSRISVLKGSLLMTTLASPGITPSVALVVLIGNQANTGAPGQLVPPSASLSLTGIFPSLSLMVPAPPAANLVLGGTLPSTTMTHIQVPTVASLSINSGSVNVVQGSILALPNGTIFLGPAAPFVNRNLLTFASSLQLTGNVPTASISSVLAAQTGSMTVTGAAPIGLPGSSITINSGTGTLAGIAPMLSSATVIPTASLKLSSASAALNLTIAPAVNALTLASIAPSVNGKLTLPTATGALTTASINPVLGLGIAVPAAPVSLVSNSGTLGLAITPQSGGSVLLSNAPSVSLSGLPLALTGSALFATSAPIVGIGFAPVVAVVRAQGVQPIVNSLTSLIALSGTVALSSDAPSVNQTGVIVAAVAELAVTGITVVFQRTGFVSPPAAALVLDSESPLSQQTTVGFITPPSGAVVMIGQPFYIMRYEPDLYYVVNSRGPAQHIVKSPG